MVYVDEAQRAIRALAPDIAAKAKERDELRSER
jgi:hypothetical protein